MANPIPTKSRDVVRQRDQGRCVRCGSAGNQWHHRRSRRVHDDHMHCACNGVTLCGTCHNWVHAHPTEAKEEGLLVTAFTATPYIYPFTGYYGRVMPACDGSLIHAVYPG